MNIFGKPFSSLVLAVGILTACNSIQSTPTLSQADIMQTAIITVNTAIAETQRAIPTATALPLPTIAFHTPAHTTPTSPPLPPTSTPLVFTDPSIPLSKRIVYYYAMWQPENPIPEGTVHAVHLFAPTYADETYTSDTAADLRTALELVLHVDDRRVWNSDDLKIADVTFRNGHADVVLQGDYFAMGDAQPCAASLQILMTVFANPSVQTATITLNGGAFGGLCIFRDGDPPLIQTVNGVHTRAAVETYMKENAYLPTATPTLAVSIPL